MSTESTAAESTESMTTEDETMSHRVAELEKRVADLEAQVKVFVAFMQEKARFDAETRAITGKTATPPEKVDREDAVSIVGRLLRPLLAGVAPEHRGAVVEGGAPADALGELAASGTAFPAETRAQFATVERYAREHALTWADLDIAA
jgi:hypothetical protein